MITNETFINIFSFLLITILNTIAALLRNILILLQHFFLFLIFQFNLHNCIGNCKYINIHFTHLIDLTVYEKYIFIVKDY
jgi:hypothetical protein